MLGCEVKALQTRRLTAAPVAVAHGNAALADEVSPLLREKDRSIVPGFVSG